MTDLANQLKKSRVKEEPNGLSTVPKKRRKDTLKQGDHTNLANVQAIFERGLFDEKAESRPPHKPPSEEQTAKKAKTATNK